MEPGFVDPWISTHEVSIRCWDLVGGQYCIWSGTWPSRASMPLQNPPWRMISKLFLLKQLVGNSGCKVAC